MAGQRRDCAPLYSRPSRTIARADFGYSFDPKNPIVRLHEPTFSAGEINAAPRLPAVDLRHDGSQGQEVRGGVLLDLRLDRRRDEQLGLVGQPAGRGGARQSGDQGWAQAGRRGDRAGALLVDHGVAADPVRAGAGDRRHRPGDIQHRSQRDREGDRAQDPRRHDRAGLRQPLRDGCDRRHLQAPQPDPDRGLLRGAGRLLRRQGQSASSAASAPSASTSRTISRRSRAASPSPTISSWPS